MPKYLKISMKNNSKNRLNYSESKKHIEELNPEILSDIDYNKKYIVVIRGNIKERFKPPLCFPDINLIRKSLLTYKKHISKKPKPYLIILIRAGNAVLGYFEDGKNKYHKVIRKYMVRKKQGKAQIKYLHKKGKSKLGSRIRLAQTKKFFNEINEKIEEWNINDKIENIFFYCPIRLWSLLFNTKSKPIFHKKDKRLVKIPLDIKIPNIKQLKRADYYIKSGYIKYETI
jgi:hypothetical protein